MASLITEAYEAGRSQPVAQETAPEDLPDPLPWDQLKSFPTAHAQERDAENLRNVVCPAVGESCLAWTLDYDCYTGHYLKTLLKREVISCCYD